MCKTCSSCLITKELFEFTKRTSTSYRAKCKVCTNKKSKEWVKKNPEIMKITRKKQYEKLKDTEYFKTLNSKKCTNYRKTHPEVFRYHTSMYRAQKLKATPVWANIEQIRLIYLNCPKGYEVDHIIPLRGKSVSGFHVPNNLQYLLMTENRQKSNKFN